jgi:hypothetical protein
MPAFLVVVLIFIVLGVVSLHFWTRLRRLSVADAALAPLPSANRFRPMLRLLSAEDEALVAANKPLARKLKRQRREIFRDYLSCLSGDYGRLLAGIRQVMVESGVDRPDLANALVKNQLLFTIALCRIEYRLFLHGFGVGSVDVSGLVEAMSVLRTQLSAFTQVAMPALSGAH